MCDEWILFAMEIIIITIKMMVTEERSTIATKQSESNRGGGGIIMDVETIAGDWKGPNTTTTNVPHQYIDSSRIRYGLQLGEGHKNHTNDGDDYEKKKKTNECDWKKMTKNKKRQ